MVKKYKSHNVKAKPPEIVDNNPKTKVTGLKTFSDQNKHWYDLPTEAIGAAIKQVVIQIDTNNKDITSQFDIYANMYGSYENTGFNVMDQNQLTFDTSTNIPTYNIVQSITDTLMSQIVEDNPKPVFITSGADYFTKLKAEKQTQFVQGIFQQTNFYDIINNQVLRDAAILGTGSIKWRITKDNKIACEWVFLDDIKVDKVDSFKKLPRSLFFCSLQQKEVLLEEFPDSAEELNSLCSQHPEYFRSRDTVVEVMVTIEAFHLKCGDKPGRHIITCEEVVLLDEEYDEDYYPSPIFQLINKPTGLYGRGVTETVYSDQIEINKQLLMIQQIQELQAAPLILLPNSAQISQDVIGLNNIARFVPYAGQVQPTFVSPQAGDPQLYSHLLWRIQASYQEFGISLTQAAAVKQPGVDSAVAMRTMIDVQNKRFIQIQKNWQKFVIDNASVVMKLAKKAYEKDSSFSVQYTDKKSKMIKEIPWKDINAPNDEFVIQIDTTSSFPASFSGRVSTVMDMFTTGIFSQPRTLEMLGMDPDLDEEYRRQTSSLRLCEKRLSDMVENNIYYKPEPYMDTKLAQKTSEMIYNQLVIDECPEERLQLVRNWINELAIMNSSPDPRLAQLQQAFADDGAQQTGAPSGPAPAQPGATGVAPPPPQQVAQ